MQKQLTSSIQIRASKQKIWDILMDFEKYPEWNPFIKKLIGNVQVGNRIEVKLQNMTFKPTVLILDKQKEFKWLGHFCFKGLFDGEHRFLLTDNGEGTVLFEQSEQFSGLLVPLFASSLDKDTQSGFEQMNEALKKRAEKTE